MGIRLAVALLGLILTPNFITAGDVQDYEYNLTAGTQVTDKTVEGEEGYSPEEIILNSLGSFTNISAYGKDRRPDLAKSLVAFVKSMPGGEEFTKTWPQVWALAKYKIRALLNGGDYVLITINDNRDPKNPKPVEFMTLLHDTRDGDDDYPWRGHWNHTAGSWW